MKIYTKAAALSTGAVIVDLPGVHDSNAARAAVAQGYMKQCTGLWIVAPINRAVDDKAAKNLLGDSFKRQLKYDGGFSNVTFICSKTDDIAITEAIDTLELEDEVEGLYEQQRRYERTIKTIQETIEDLRESREVYRIAQAEASKDIDIWDQLKDELEDGRTVLRQGVTSAREAIAQGRKSYESAKSTVTSPSTTSLYQMRKMKMRETQMVRMSSLHVHHYRTTRSRPGSRNYGRQRPPLVATGWKLLSPLSNICHRFTN